jgi:hypothetical protein
VPSLAQSSRIGHRKPLGATDAGDVRTGPTSSTQLKNINSRHMRRGHGLSYKMVQTADCDTPELPGVKHEFVYRPAAEALPA